MSNIDPLTHLPKKEENTLESQKRELQAYENFRANTSLTIGGTTPVQGAFGRYDPERRVTSDRNFNERRAQDQGFFELAGKSLGQMAGIALGGTVSAIGFVGDMPGYIGRMLNDTATGDEQQQPFERNVVSQLGHSIENYFFDTFEIYQTERAQEGGFNPFASGSRLRDSTFVFSQIPSIVSTVSLMIPSYGIGRGLSMLGRAAGAGQNTQRFVTTVGAAVANRHNYNMMEGFDLMDRMQERLMNEEGYTLTEAKEIASKASADFYKTAYVNLWKDMLAWGALLRGFNYASRNATGSIANTLSQSQSASARQLAQQMLRNPSATAKQMINASPYNWKDVLLQSGLEGFEEFNIQFQKSVSERNSDIALGLADGDIKGFLESYFSMDSIDALLNDKEIQNATLMGFFGGATFQAAGAGYNRYRNTKLAGEQAERVQQLEKSLNYMKEQLSIIENASAEGNTEVALQAEENLLTSMAFSALTIDSVQSGGSLLSGDLANNIEMFEAIAEMDNETLSGEQFGFKDPNEVKQRARRQADQLKEISEMFDRNLSRESSMGFENVVKAIQITEQEFLNKKADERKTRLGSEIDAFYSGTEIKAAMSQLSPEQQTEVRQRARLRALKNLRKNKGDLTPEELLKNGLNAYRFGILKRTRDKIVEKIDAEIAQIESEISETPSKEVSSFISTHLKNENHNSLQNRNAINDYLIEEGNLNLVEYASPENMKNILNVIETKAKNIQDQVFQYMIRKEATDGKYVRIGDETFLISTEGETVNIQKYDTETGELTGDPRPFKADDIAESESEQKDFQFFDADQIVSPELREKTNKEFEKALDSNLESSLSTLDKMFFSGFTEEYNAGVKKVKKAFTDKLNTFQDAERMLEYVMELNERVKNRELLQELNTAFVDLQNKLAETYRAELDKLTAAMSQEQELLSKKQRELKEINKKIKGIKEKLKSAELEKTKELLSEKYNEVVSERDERIAALKEQNATASEINKVRKEYEQKLKEQYEQALQQNPEAQKEILNLRSEINETIKDLRSKKRELKKKEQEIQRVVDTYNRILNKENKLGFKSYILSEISTLEQKIEHSKLGAVMDAGYSLRSLRGKIANIDGKIDQAIEELTLYDEYLETISNGNIVIKRARAAALATVLSGPFSIKDLDTLPLALLQRYKSELTKEITGRIKSTHAEGTQNAAEVVKLVNETRREMLASEDSSIVLSSSLSPDVISKWEQNKDNLQRAIKSLPNTLQDLQDLHLEHKILNDIISAMESVVVAKETGNNESSTQSGNNNPKRTLETLFQRFTGKDHVDNELVSDEASIKYGQFVNSVNPAEKPVQMKIVKYDDLKEKHGALMPAEVEQDYKNRKTTILYALPTNNEGKYYTMSGEVTDTFDPEVNVYTSFPSTVSDLLFVNDDASLKKRYPEAKTEEQRKKLFEQDYNQRLEEHKKFTQELIDTIESGQEAVIPVTGKNVGVPIEDNKKSYSDGFVPNPLESVVGPDFTLAIAKGDQMTINGITYDVYPGKMYAHNPNNGNLYRIERRRVSETEVDSFLELMSAYVQQQEIAERGSTKRKKKKAYAPGEVPEIDMDAIDQEIARQEAAKKGKRGSSAKLIKEVDINGEKVNIFNYINDVFGSAIEIAVLDNKLIVFAYPTINGKASKTRMEFPLFKTDESGNLINELADSEGLRDVLGTIIHNVRDKTDGDYVQTTITSDGVRSKLYEGKEGRTGYEQFLIEENVIGTRIKKASKEIFSAKGGQEFEIDSFQFMNQNFTFSNPYMKAASGSKPTIVAGSEISSTQKAQLQKLLSLSKGVFSDKRRALAAHVAKEITKAFKNKNNTVANLNDIYDSIIDLDIKELGETIIPESKKKTQDAKRKFIADWVEIHEKVLVADGFVTIGAVLDADTIELMNQIKRDESGLSKEDVSGEEVVIEGEDSSPAGISKSDIIKGEVAEGKKKTESKDDTSGLDPFDSALDEFSINSSQRAATTQEIKSIVKSLNNRMPFETVVLTRTETESFIQQLRDEGWLKDGNVVVNGMFYKGKAYVFSNAKLDTPFHEVSHPIISSILKNNPELSEALTNEMLNNEEYSAIYNEVLETYPHAINGENVNFDAVAEALTTILGIESARAFDSQSLSNKIWQAIKQYFRDMFNMPAVDINKLSPTTTLAEIGTLLGATQQRIQVGNVEAPTTETSKIKADSGTPVSELGFNDKTWYLLSHNEQQSILRCS